MAPYAIAHMKIGLKLAETGYRFGTEERARIYLTNALEPWVKTTPAHRLRRPRPRSRRRERNQTAQALHRRHRQPAVFNFGQLNKDTFIRRIAGRLQDGGLDEKKLNLDDDYMKFVRFAQ